MAKTPSEKVDHSDVCFRGMAAKNHPIGLSLKNIRIKIVNGPTFDRKRIYLERLPTNGSKNFKNEKIIH
jgi:hypothetical protein